MSVLDDPRLYNAVQIIGGWKFVTARRLRSVLAGASGQVLDVGAGTGNVAALLPPDTTYVAVDNDPVRVRPVIDDILWRVDRGCHPRPETTLLAALRTHFIVDRVERLRPLHESLLCLARPAPG